MTVAYIDCFSGISGDMVLGALVDAGVPFEELKAALAKLPVDGYEISCRHVKRCGIGGTQVQVRLVDDHGHGHAHEDGHGHEHGHGGPHEHQHPHEHGHGRDHEHKHDHQHGHDHDHSHSHTHTHADGHSHTHSHSHEHHHHHAPHRGFSAIKGIIEASEFSEVVKRRAIDAFRRIAVEEAAVHETTVEDVHFHEVGAVDAIVDIVGAMWCIERLGITRVMASQVAVGSGTIRVAHGEMPIPAPATARLLAGKPICTGPVSGELATPTGAAILTTLTEEFGPLNNFLISKVAYGAGTREYPQNTNYLRVLIGEVQETAGAPGAGLPLIREELLIVTAEIDDMPAELMGSALEAMMLAGALDCHFIPVQMKKNRPAVSVHVLAEQAKINTLLEILFKQTTTLGVKVVPCTRLSMDRRREEIDTAYGPIRIKLGLWGDNVMKASPEFEDCKHAAQMAGVGVMDVFMAASSAATAHYLNREHQ